MRGKSSGNGRGEAAVRKPVVFSDFDGTITRLDVTDEILENFAVPGWREVEAQWLRGEIGSRECFERQTALVRVTPKQLNALIDGIPLDADFPAFYRTLRTWRVPFYILSDSFDYVIRRVLKRAGANAELRNGRHLFSTGMRLEGGRMRALFPHSNHGCDHGCATCKPAIMRRIQKKQQPVIFIGDGLSDRFAVEAADVVFAKQELLAYCRKRGIACRAFENFGDVQKDLAEMLESGSFECDAAVGAAT
ncbi:MAG TPA: MtnX-like HAD-IB family phosphatase [Terriglobia bacterium]|nr:MtnX-like HAD-IB family phosphatase [Terriglobia bacterium]